ncbi:MAG TPA: branched-chain amino acid ABC transporter permease, partial [Acidimicrobiales bacterium]|nr:branched-chain amino acid ABC transporter permease [Acidimicrobiales bacterium]
AFAAAAMARMERIPTAVAATFLLTTFSEAFRYSFPDDEALVSVLLFASLVAVLLLQGRSAGRAETGQAVTWSAVEEQRPVPRVLATIAAVRAVRWGLAAFGLLLLGVLPFIVPVRFVEQASVLCLAGIVTISIVVLTGWGGQVSLGQWGFAAVGATVGGALTATLGVPFWIAVPLAAVVTGGVAVAVGIPALRIPGLFLLPVTFAFAVAAQFTLFSDRYFGWLRPDKTVERPTLFFLDFRDGTSMYFLCLACLVLTIVLVGNLRRSRTGRILIALRENDANVQAFGVNVVRTKLLAFAISGALSGFAGAVFAHQQQGISFASYSPQRSVNAFIEAVFGGVGSVAGALLGAGFYIVTNYLSLSPVLRLVTDRGLPILLIFAAPAGIISLVNAARDSVLRVIAQRRQLIVPSLFADVDPDAL